MSRYLVAWLLCFLCCSLFGEEQGETRIVIVGDGIGESNEGVDSQTFAKLLAVVAEQRPDIVFFSGNLINGLEQSTSIESVKLLKNHLDQFTRLTTAYLGKDVKIYPVIGNHTFVNSRAVHVFKEHFGIKDSAPLESYQWAYTVDLDHVQFIIMASGLFERKYRGYRQGWRSMPLLHWLEKELRTGTDVFSYRFVIGHMPAYSSLSTEGVYIGLDKDKERRDDFWKVLKDNKALGYFSSHEPLYDRSNRGGVWQIISGGPVKEGDLGSVFQHFILITIPNDQSKNPVLESIDLKGKVWDEFEIIPIDRPVHQLRIS